MSAFFDTNVLVYVFDPADPLKQQRARRLLHDHAVAHEVVLSTQVLLELYVVVVRKGFLGAPAALAAVRELSRERIVCSDPDFVIRALALSQKHRWSAFDAFVVQAALDAECHTLFSEDLQHGRQVDGLRIVNPFTHEVHEPAPAYKPLRRAKRSTR